MHSNTQHGRQPPPQPAAPPTDPRIRNVPSAGTTAADSQGVCRDFVWGICSLGAQCKYRHELEFESMKAILKFCHDHQNRTGCTRSDCTYLHTSRDEENLFLTTGQIPRVLMERYTENMSSMSATPGASTSNAEPVPPVATVPPHMYDYLVQGLPPPPPPPPPAPGPNAPPQPMSMTMPSSMPPPISMPAMPAPIMLGMPGPMPPMLAPPPPPPPPPTAPVTSMRVAGPAYSAPSTSQAVAPYQPQTQPQLPVLFDPSRPPPPLPLATRKRQVEDEHEAGPSKLRKSEPNIDGSCESCVQRQIRCRMVTQQIENIEQDNDNQRMEINRKMEDYEKKKMVLKTMLRPDFYRIAEEYIENVNNAGSSNVNQFNDLMEVIFNNSMPTMNSPFNLNNSSMFPLLLQIISGNNSRGGIRDASPVPEEHNLLQVLNARPRANQNENLIMSTLLDFMSNTSERNAARDIGDNRLIDNDLNRPTSSAISNNSNGISRLINDSVSPPMSVQSSSRYANMRAIEGVPGPSGLANSRSYCESVPPAAPLPPTRAYETVPAPVPNPYETRQYLENNIVGPGNSVPYDSAGPSGVHHYADGLAGALARPYADNGAGPSRYPPAQAAPPRQYHPGLCEGATMPQNAPPAAAPPMYVPGPYAAPTQPPVARNYYQFPQNNMANAGYPGMPAGQAPRPPTAGMPVSQAPRPPTANMPTIPQNQQNYQHYMGRYPFYPPF